ncbi:SigE family RNA polymerase sigma factor [Herbidospora sp. NEAU-GS84]|uniref:SigE family RNA polymerase sigma factor n=1 Tax=Herbidospora solisilvae TaxID=2696284 RepID=A0A7C9N1M8_9ACTN|nr:SigE family RNA polymerase sigma factor [Herbidospora solisilvae]NAS21694.1 SigE family RNA polymerase sigma factor [Herbidospora solisilvae]
MRDRADFERYVEQRSARLLRMAYLLCRDWATAEDLTQTALAKAWLAWRRVGDNPDAYVYRILVNTHNSWWRRMWRREVATGELPDLTDPGIEETLDDRDVLRAALATLPPKMRAVLVLRYFEDLSDAGIAAILGCSEVTVRSQASRALAKLRVDPAMDWSRR